MSDRITTRPALVPLLAALIAFAACGRDPAAADAASTPPVVVRTVTPQPLAGGSLVLSGVVRARHESPLAFQIGGRIGVRQVDSGALVRRGQALMTIDASDLDAALAAAEAERAAAIAALAVAGAERQRADGLVAGGFLSAQGADRAALLEREARTRLAAAENRLRQSANAVAYATLRAPASGVLAEVVGEPGQVVAPGQPVATLAHDGAREIEVHLPDGVAAPEAGELALAGKSTLRLALRELAGAADTRSRTWRARYRVAGPADGLRLGSVMRVVFPLGGDRGALTRVPLGALDERGAGPRVWVVEADRVRPQPIELVGLSGEEATIRGDLPVGARIVALGAHLLQPGMAVREQGR
jgi:RND family efflux transporter MFP subunit